MTAKEEWLKLINSINLAYYIGKPAVALIHAKVTGSDPAPGPKTIGIDVDNDGVVDKKVVLEK